MPTRPLAADEADAAAIFKILAKLGGPQLVGAATELDPKVFLSPRSRRPTHAMIRLVSLVLFLALWQVGAWFVGPHFLPEPLAVGGAIVAETRNGEMTS